ncbi:MAG: hypothetical protein JO131_02710, partial [Gammaproteobacteria bacterium]|nr:hypothetical protein [Gammaproteobacteria bacterium]
LNYNALSTPLNITLTSIGSKGINGTASSSISAFNNINNIVGTTSSNNTITGLAVNNSWTLTGPNAITYSTNANTLALSNFQNIIGGSANNNFIFTPGGTVTNINGGGSGVNILNYSNYGSTMNANLQTNTASGITNTFININQIIGDTTNKGTLTAANGPNIWNITGANTGNVTGLANGFSNISNLIGGSSGPNNFNFASGASILGSISGGNTTSINTITIADGVQLILTSLTRGNINLLSNNANIVSFSQIQQATSSGQTGYLSVPATTSTIIFYNPPTNTSGEIDDPFYFYNFIIGNPPPPPSPPPPTPTIVPPANITNVMVSTNYTTAAASDSSSPSYTNDITIQPNGEPAPSIVTEVVENIAITDLEDDQKSVSYGCFSAR